MSVAEETAAVVDILPPGKAQSVLDFAKYLAEQEEEAAWGTQFCQSKEFRKVQQLGQ